MQRQVPTHLLFQGEEPASAAGGGGGVDSSLKGPHYPEPSPLCQKPEQEV